MLLSENKYMQKKSIIVIALLTLLYALTAIEEYLFVSTTISYVSNFFIVVSLIQICSIVGISIYAYNCGFANERFGGKLAKIAEFTWFTVIYVIFIFINMHFNRLERCEKIESIPYQYFIIFSVSTCTIILCFYVGKMVIPHIFRHSRPESLILANVISTSDSLLNEYKCFEKYANVYGDDISNQISCVSDSINCLREELKNLQKVIY